MSTRTITIVFAGAETKNLPGGRFLFVKSATGSLDITLREQGGTPNQLLGVGAGARYKLQASDEPWRFTDLTSLVAQTVVIVLSDDAEFDIANTVTVAGAVTQVELPSTVIATPASVAPVTATAASIAANAARRRITFSALSTNTGSVFVQATGGGAGRGIELQPGTFVEVVSTAAIDLRNDSGATQTIGIFEES